MPLVRLSDEVRAVEFDGELIYEKSLKPDDSKAHRWLSLRVWRSESGRWVAEYAYHTTKRNEINSTYILDSDTKDSLINELRLLDPLEDVDFWDVASAEGREAHRRANANTLIERTITQQWDQLVSLCAATMGVVTKL